MISTSFALRPRDNQSSLYYVLIIIIYSVDLLCLVVLNPHNPGFVAFVSDRSHKSLMKTTIKVIIRLHRRVCVNAKCFASVHIFIHIYNYIYIVWLRYRKDISTYSVCTQGTKSELKLLKWLKNILLNTWITYLYQYLKCNFTSVKYIWPIFVRFMVFQTLHW